MQKKDFINENIHLIFNYINSEILKEVGEINFDYFFKLVKSENIEFENYDINFLPYIILSNLEGKGKMDYTSMRADTIFLKDLNKEAKAYYNYAKFYIENQTFFIDLMQMKIGGMPIDKDILKYRKEIPIIKNAFEEFIKKNKKG